MSHLDVFTLSLSRKGRITSSSSVIRVINRIELTFDTDPTKFNGIDSITDSMYIIEFGNKIFEMGRWT